MCAGGEGGGGGSRLSCRSLCTVLRNKVLQGSDPYKCQSYTHAADPTGFFGKVYRKPVWHFPVLRQGSTKLKQNLWATYSFSTCFEYSLELPTIFIPSSNHGLGRGQGGEVGGWWEFHHDQTSEHARGIARGSHRSIWKILHGAVTTAASSCELEANFSFYFNEVHRWW